MKDCIAKKNEKKNNTISKIFISSISSIDEYSSRIISLFYSRK